MKTSGKIQPSTTCFLAGLFALALVVGPFALPVALAHQPNAVDAAGPVEVTAPEISKAYYAELDGEAAEYVIDSPEPFDLYAGLTVADLPGAETDFVLEVEAGGGPLFRADGAEHSWTAYHERFANDIYLNGPEYRLADAPAGRYVVRVSSPDNRGKYVLAIGEIEDFGPAATLDAIRTASRLKSDYFGKTGWSFAVSLLGGPFLLVAVALGAFAGLLYRRVLKLLPVKKAQRLPGHRKNIGLADRLLRLGIALALLAVGVHFWLPCLFLLSGFVFYEAAASWCVLHAAIGRNTCPL
ncbi:DUF2892 domain-containing protein [Patescibacteria group bacterium]